MGKYILAHLAKQAESLEHDFRLTVFLNQQNSLIIAHLPFCPVTLLISCPFPFLICCGFALLP